MHTTSQQKRHSSVSKNKQPAGQLMTLTLSLVGYGVIHQRAFADTLVCPVSENTQITNPTDNNQACVINADTSGGSPLTLSIENSSLNNQSAGQLTNYGTLYNSSFDAGTATLNNTGTLSNNYYLINDSYGAGSSSNLTNFGTLTNNYNSFLFNDSYGEGSSSNLTNYQGANLINDGGLYNGSFYAGTTTLTNSGTLTNNLNLYNESDGTDSSSTLTNTLGAELTNDGYLYNSSYNGGTSNLTNTGTLINYNYLYNVSDGTGSSSTLTNTLGAELTNDGFLYNRSYNGGTGNLTNSSTLINNNYLYNQSDGTGSSSTLTNALGSELFNDGNLYNRSVYGGTSNLTNSNTLINNHYLYNESDGVGSSSTLTNSLGAELTNDGNLYNRSYYGGTSTLNNSGSLTNSGYLFNDGHITNSGTFDISTGGLLYNDGSFEQTAGSTVVNGKIYGSGTVNIQGGSLSGSGYVEASTITIGENAAVNPGNSPGTLIMVGDVDWSGTLGTDIMSSTVYDMLEVQGVITLDDTSSFEFAFDSSYVALDGDAFDFLSAYQFDFGLGADFASWFNPSQFSVTGLAAGFGWNVSFVDDQTNSAFSYMWLNVFDASQPVSTPTSITLFGLGLSLLGLSIRRKKLRTLSA